MVLTDVIHASGTIRSMLPIVHGLVEVENAAFAIFGLPTWPILLDC